MVDFLLFHVWRRIVSATFQPPFICGRVFRYQESMSSIGSKSSHGSLLILFRVLAASVVAIFCYRCNPVDISVLALGCLPVCLLVCPLVCLLVTARAIL
ncbi:hypothetical protein J3E72DRAFT_340059, partial [Bipolaris maydis]|uniref:uncharacterized protein n=1 Tax=Cochliobolus heterostrophus TaxID=5016 RepID=UPI0024DB7DF4